MAEENAPVREVLLVSDPTWPNSDRNSPSRPGMVAYIPASATSPAT